MSSENRVDPNADTVEAVEGNTGVVAIGETAAGSAESRNCGMVGNYKHENREIP